MKPDYSRGGIDLYNGEALEVLPQLGLVDAVVADPPYSSGGLFRGDRMQSTLAKYVATDSGNQAKLADFSGDNRDQRAFGYWSALWMAAAFRITRPGGIACVFSDWRQLPASTDYFQAGGWTWRGIAPWHKPTGRPMRGRFRQSTEFVVWGSRGPLGQDDRGVGCLPGLFTHSAPRKRYHIAQKPVELLSEVVAICTPGGRVLDPFVGSGTAAIAAIDSGRTFVGIELDAGTFDAACRRLDAWLDSRAAA